MSMKQKRQLFAGLSVAGFTLAYYACNGISQEFLTYQTGLWLMAIGVVSCVLFGWKSGYLR